MTDSREDKDSEELIQRIRHICVKTGVPEVAMGEICIEVRLARSSCPPASKIEGLREAIRICREDVLLCDEDVIYDNTKTVQDGDGTAYNRGVVACDLYITNALKSAVPESAPSTNAANGKVKKENISHVER